MAEIFPDEGLDLSHGIFPQNGSNIATLYCFLFTSQTGSTVPTRDATGGATPSGWTETTYPSYARQAVPAASWGAPATTGPGREITAAQITFPTVGAGASETINGFGLATAISSQAGDTIVYFANFDDLAPIVTSENGIIRVTPRWRKDG